MGGAWTREGDQATIQAAVTAANAGDTINVEGGTYAPTSTITISQALTIKGSDGATVNVTPATQNGFMIQADDVTIDGLDITGPVTGGSYIDFDWNASGQSRGIFVWKGADNFTISGNTITGIRTGIIIDGRNTGGSVTGNTIDNTKGAVLVQYTDAGVGTVDGYSDSITGNSIGVNGNEWGLITHLNGHLDAPNSTNTPLVNPWTQSPIPAVVAPSGVQQQLSAASTNNDNWTVEDQKYTRSSRTAVTVAATGGDDSTQGSPRSPLATVQAGVDAVVAGGTVNVAAGTYTDGVSIAKPVTIDGAGSGTDATANTVIQGPGSGTGSGIQITNGPSDVTIKDLRSTGWAYGISFGSTTPATDVSITSSSFDDNKVGLKVATAASVDGLTITESHFDGNTDGVYVAADKTNPGTFTNVNVSDSTFSNNPDKGLYIEKMSNATFDNITVSDSGTADPSKGSGFNINLKYGAYSAITVKNSTIDGSNGASGSGFRIEARDDGSYASPSASLSGVTLSNNTVTGNAVGLMFGEPGGSNAGPTGVALTGNKITSNTTALTNNADSAIDVSGNYWGSADPDIDSVIDNAGSGSVTYKSFYTDADTSKMTLLVGNVSGFASTGYASIQDAVSAAAAGDTIEVGAGSYTGTQVSLNKDDLALKGAQAGVDARTRSGSETVITGGRLDIAANDVTIDGFTLDGPTDGSGNPSAAIYGSGHDGTQILNNIIENGKFGAQFDNSGNSGTDAALVQYNAFKDNNLGGSTGGTGLFMLGPSGGSPNVTISDNSFTGHPTAAINFTGSNSTITGNTSNGDATLAVVTDSSDVTISGNTETDGADGSGIFLGLGNDGVTVTGNTLNSAASASDGTSAIRVSNAFGGGSAATPSQNYTITKNVVTGGWSYGLRASADAYSGNLSLRSNQFSAGVTNNDPDTVIDATRNWWNGSVRSSGSGAVSTDPWCQNTDCTTLSNAVPPVNKAPTANSVSVTVAQGSSVGVSLSGSDPDGDALTFTHGGAGHGSVSGSGASLTYTPAAGYSGSDAFSFTVSDGKGGSATGVVTVLVTPTVVKPPTAQSISVSTVANTAVGVTVSGSDPNGLALTYTHGGAGHGSVSGSGASLTYTPAKDYSGSDSFSFTVTNTAGGTASGTVSVTVAAAPLSPPVTQTVVAGGTAAWTPPTTGGTGTPASPPAVVPSVTVPDGGTVTFTPITTPAGTGSGSGSGTGASSGSGSGSTYTLLTQSFIISAPAATADAPLALNFAIDTSNLPQGTDSANLTVFRNGIAVPACTDSAATVAAPDPCVDPVTTASGQASITVLSSHASTWTFGTAVLTAPSKLKVAGIRGVGPGGTEKVAVRLWNDDGSFAASTPVTIAVSGANTANGVVTTNAKGFATFTYTPKKLGTDTVTATAGTVTGTATVHIVPPAQRPTLGAVSRNAGTVNIAVRTSPVVENRKVKIYAVRKVRGHRATLVYVGSAMTNGKGRAHLVIKLASGQSFVLKARMAGSDYVEHLSNRATGTVK